MKIKKLLFSTILYLLMVYSAIAQFQASGTVKDSETGEPLLGATVMVKGTNIGTVTDFDGAFQLTVPDQDVTLEISYSGYQTLELAAGSNLQINLEVDISKLNEVVVIGYGTQKKSDLTGSVSGMDSETLVESQTTDVFSAMQGRMSGVQISSDSGQPGGGSNITIRGQTSLNGTSSPLFVIDGVQIDVNYNEVATTGSSQARINPLTGINPADIESVDILKDASATAIYGSRGANGVVIITTKSGGTDGRLVADYTYNLGVSNIIKKLPVLSAQDYLIYQQERGNGQFLNEDTDNDGVFETPRNFDELPSFDWQEEGLRTAISHQHQLNMRGGNKTTNFSAGLGYLNQEGLVINNDYDQYNLRLRLKGDVNDRLSLTFSTNGSYSVLSGIANSGGPDSFTGVTQQLVLGNPWNIRTDDIDFADDAFISPIALIEESDKQTSILRFLGNLNIDYKITDNLTYTAFTGANISHSKVKEFYNSNTGWGRLQNGRAIVREVGTYSVNHSSQLNFKKNFSQNHQFDALGALEIFHYNYEDFLNEVIGFENQTTGVNNISVGTSVSEYSTQRWNTNRLSFLGRVNYTLFERYLLTASMRADGSDKFGKNNRWGYFPSAALAWKISEESFLKDSRTISNLKLRLSYGATGNERIPPYTYLAQLDPAFYASNDNLIFGLAPSSLPNPNLKWETTKQSNVGLDVGLFKGRISLGADFYQKITTDLLLNAPIPSQSGFNSQWQNIGRIDNTGFELQVTTFNINKNNFKWKTDFNISFNKNEVKDLGGAEFIPISTFGGWQSNVGRVIVGEPIGTMYGYDFEGIYQIDDFTWQNDSDPNIPFDDRNFVLKEELPVYSGTALPGRMKYKDVNGDGFVNDEDRKVIGNSNPLHFGGINNTFTYKNFDLSVFFQWSYGNEIYNATKVRLNGVLPWMNISPDYFENHWTPDNPSNTAPAYGAIDQQIASSYYVEDGSYLRLRTVSLGYRIPKDLTKRLGFNSLRLNLIGNNLATWTNYSGWDPEINFNNPLLSGLDRIAYPRAKNFTLSINATF
ncbi:SusC/RagA family TonB-linked outer membrane protein [Leeuwenhoekiella parthenopeia]|uniref:TonB-dependent receptor n=1 Tax=Leeuwenhoekiella parthenopeia TaxID=2890320 RepID=A0ABS8GS72_9FLAO|nr:TonB-dependent receptor [Leeuwenhoekiella parthenopeia]MCC4211996.1 TonB-dependent receptor [Leeuwenhoekiella parthenopeia]